MIRQIAGRQNHSVKLVRKLQKKKHRRERGLIVCEGMDLLVAAVSAGARVQDVLVRSDLLEQLPAKVLEEASEASDANNAVDIGVCDRETLEYASSLGGAADVVFSCVQPSQSLSDLDLSGGTAFFLDGVGDPGNVGTLVRSLAAFGGVGAICSPGTADPHGPRAMRAGMGAQFVLPVVTEVTEGQLTSRLLALEERGEPLPQILVADPHSGDDVRTLAPIRGVLVVLGSERSGTGTGWADARRVRIPQHGFESLNVGMAGTILAYELCRTGRAMHNGNRRCSRED